MTSSDDKQGIRDAFHNAIQLKTLVITCTDPRASGVQEAVGREFGQTPWPGKITYDDNGAKMGSTTNVAIIVNAGGRAADALRSITTLNYLIGMENIVVVHHTFCGSTGFTPDDLINDHEHEHGANIANSFDPATISIQNFDTSLRHDVDLIRNAPGTAKHLNIFGYVYDIDAESLTKVIEDLGAKPSETKSEALVS